MWFAWLLACTQSTPSLDSGSTDDSGLADSGLTDSDSATDSDPQDTDTDPQDTDTDPQDTDTDTDPPAELPDWSVAGPGSSTGRTETLTTTTGCTAEVQLFGDDPATAPVTVMLSHGFARSSANMVGLGAHLATWGVAVAVPQLCHSSLFDTDHPQNGADLVAMADQLGATKVIYAGQSAGGLASVIAGTQDTATVGVIGLDPVDTGDLGTAAAANLTVPFDVLKGAPSACNSQGNATAIASAAPAQRVLTLPGATHCTFESPTGFGCTALCGGDPNPDVQRGVIRMLVTAAVLERSGLNANAGGRWESTDPWLQAQITAGVVQP